MKRRNIAVAIVLEIINKSEQVIRETDKDIYQSVIFKDNKHYLLRVFINNIKNPPVVITIYKTSKH
jgi:hypothetical protein